MPAVGASDAPLVDADSRLLRRWNTPLIIFFEAVAAATMTIALAAANLTPTAENPTSLPKYTANTTATAAMPVGPTSRTGRGRGPYTSRR